MPGCQVNGRYSIGSSTLPHALELKINADLVAVLMGDAVKKRLDVQSIEVRSSTPEELMAHARAEIPR